MLCDKNGNSTTAIEFRIAKATRHFHAHEKFYCNRTVPLVRRIRAFAAGTHRSMLWGCGGWILSKDDLQKLEVVEKYFGRRILRTRWRRTSETWVEYMQRSAKLCKTWFRKAGIRPLEHQFLLSQHRWAGHISRAQPTTSPVSAMLHWRDTAWWRWECFQMSRMDNQNSTGWKHRRAGPPTRWETPLVRHHGHHLKEIAKCRFRWKRLER